MVSIMEGLKTPETLNEPYFITEAELQPKQLAETSENLSIICPLN
jgi:hypothetical protein